MEIWLLLGKDKDGRVITIDAFKENPVDIGGISKAYANDDIVFWEVKPIWVRG